ncbi:MAG: transposase [Empedobacter falsenii]
MENFKSIHLGDLIKQAVDEEDISSERICNFFKCSEQDIKQMYNMKSLDTELLLRWSKLLEYDFFRLYTQHLILYAPVAKVNQDSETTKSNLPKFRKNIYTKEIIDYLLSKINSGEMTNLEVIQRYNIPKTTLYKWMNKYTN